MISRSAPSLLHCSNSLICCNNDGSSSITNYNYNKSATIPKSLASSAERHHPHQHQSTKMVAAAAQYTRRSSTPTTTGSVIGGRPSKRSLTKLDHQRSLRYTRTLDIIPEDDDDSSVDTSHPQNDPANDNNSVGSSSNNSVIGTDFWHSQRSMKKSAPSVSLESLVSDNANERDDETNPTESGNEENRSDPSGTTFVVEDEDDDYDNFFLDDWDM